MAEDGQPPVPAAGVTGEVISSQGVLIEGGMIASYYTSEPAPEQWIAVGRVVPAPCAVRRPALRLLVGVGHDEEGAIHHLRSRLAGLGRLGQVRHPAGA